MGTLPLEQNVVKDVHRLNQGWTGMYTLVVPSLSTKFIKNSHQNLPVQPWLK